MASNRDRKGGGEVNAGSMADIAFLLLIFFLVTTTMKVDKGITVKLPPWPEDPEDIETVETKDRNTFKVLVNSRDKLLVEGERLPVDRLKDRAKRFIDNPQNLKIYSESPQDAVVSFKSHRGTSYDMYIRVYDKLKAAYAELRDEAAEKRYGRKFNRLNQKQKKKIRDQYPIKISEAEPADVGG